MLTFIFFKIKFLNIYSATKINISHNSWSSCDWKNVLHTEKVLYIYECFPYYLVLSHYACNRDTEEKIIYGKSLGFVQKLYVHWNLQKHRHVFPNSSPHNSCIICPQAKSRKALTASVTSIHCLHRTIHK